MNRHGTGCPVLVPEGVSLGVVGRGVRITRKTWVVVPSRPKSEIDIKRCAKTWTIKTYFNGKTSGGRYRWGFFRMALFLLFVDLTLWWEIHDT